MTCLGLMNQTHGVANRSAGLVTTLCGLMLAEQYAEPSLFMDLGQHEVPTCPRCVAATRPPRDVVALASGLLAMLFDLDGEDKKSLENLVSEDLCRLLDRTGLATARAKLRGARTEIEEIISGSDSCVLRYKVLKSSSRDEAAVQSIIVRARDGRIVAIEPLVDTFGIWRA